MFYERIFELSIIEDNIEFLFSEMFIEIDSQKSYIFFCQFV